MVRMSVDFPAPFGPSNPNMPAGMSSETSCSARTPLEYVFERLEIDRLIRAPGGGDGRERIGAREATAGAVRAP